MTVPNGLHLPPVPGDRPPRRPWTPAAWCGRLAPPHTKHLLTFHVPVECAVDVEDGVMPPLTRRALQNRANATAATVLAAGNWYPPASLRSALMAAALSPLSPHFQRPYMVDLSTPTAIYHTTPGTPRHTPLTLPP